MPNMASLEIAVQYYLLINHMDVKSSFLNAPNPLDKEIYVQPPEGFEGKNVNYVWNLKKSPYMSKKKQSGRTWNENSHTYLVS